MAEVILIAADHAGYELKLAILKRMDQIHWEDLGTDSPTSVDYPDFAQSLGHLIVTGKASRGILVCGTGIGMSIAANKVAGIRAAVAENPVGARLAKEHNHANILCLGARFTAPEYAVEIIQSWLDAVASDNPRHLARVKKLGGLL